MPGFGSGPFGSGPFGEFPWSKQVLFRDLPEIDRRVDAEIEGNPLETTMAVIQGPFDEILKKVRNFGDLRDALKVRTLHNEQLQVNVLKAEPSPDGRTIEVLLDNPNPDDPFDPLFGTSIGWIMTGAEGREFVVNSVHKLRETGPTIELKGSSETPATARNKGTQLTGTLTFTEGSTTVVGAGTLFTSEVSPGQLVGPLDTFDIAFVDSVTNDLNLELTVPWSGPTLSGKLSLIGDVADGAAILRPPSLIETFGEDFGIEVDRHEPEAFQRSSVYDVDQWLNLKGTDRSYDIIGKIAGYRVAAFGLWRIATATRITGTVSFTNGSVTVTGVGTSFLTEAITGYFIAPDLGIDTGIISSIVDDNTIILSTPYTGPTSNSAETIMFEEPLPEGIDPLTIFESPAGSGKLYTTTDPRRPAFDEIPADVIPTDYFCHETPDWTTNAISPPSPPPPDGTSVQVAIGWSTQGTQIIDTTFLGNNRWRVRTGSSDLSIIADVSSWYAEFAGAPGEKHYVETIPEEQLDALTGVLSFVNGSTTVTGGVAFTAELVVGQMITLGGDAPRARVVSITDDANLELEDPYQGPTDSGTGYISEWEFETMAFADFVFGSTAFFAYQCDIIADCGFCRASVIRVEVIPVEVLTDPQALLDRVLLRLVGKVQQVIPAHVRLAEIIQVLGPVQASMNYQAQGSVIQLISTTASAGFYFDIVPADEMPLDPDHYVATGSVSSVP